MSLDAIRSRFLADTLGILKQLRTYLIYLFALFVAVSAIAYAYSGRIIALVKPHSLPGFVFLAPTEAFTAKVKVALMVGALVALPAAVWSIVVAVLKTRRERMRGLLLLLTCAYGLFLLGASMCYKLVLPRAFTFFLSFARDGLRPMISLSAYISFVTSALVSFGLALQLPLVILVLTRHGVLTTGVLKERWSYIVVAAFCVSAVLTPPDLFSQVALAVFILLTVAISAMATFLINLALGRIKKMR